jgi:transposase InsO family protein
MVLAKSQGSTPEERRLWRDGIYGSFHQRQPAEEEHHSDRGLQYASTEYVEVLRKHQMIPSREPASESL